MTKGSYLMYKRKKFKKKNFLFENIGKSYFLLKPNREHEGQLERFSATWFEGRLVFFDICHMCCNWVILYACLVACKIFSVMYKLLLEHDELKRNDNGGTK